MTSREPSPELAALLRGSRPAASPELRARVREIAAGAGGEGRRRSGPGSGSRAGAACWSSCRPRLRLAIASAGVLGLARSDAPSREAVVQQDAAQTDALESTYGAEASPAMPSQDAADPTRSTVPGALAPDTTRKQRVGATMTLEVPDSDGVASSAQKAIALTQRLGGHVVNSSVITGDGANAAAHAPGPGRARAGGGRGTVGARDDRLAAGLDAGPPGRPRPARATRALGARPDRAPRRASRVGVARRRPAGDLRGRG